MKIRLSCVLFGLAICTAHTGSFVQAQSNANLGQSKKKPVANVAQSPVLNHEAHAVLSKVEASIRRVILVSAGKSEVKIQRNNSPASREAILSELSRLFDLIRPKIKFTPEFSKVNPAVFSIKNPNLVAKAKSLVEWGAIGRVAPLVSANKPTLTLLEFGDSIAFFVIRICEITHTPSSKFSPPMMGADDA